MCNFKRARKNFPIPDGWSVDEVDLFLDNILYQNVNYLNELVGILNRSLDDIVELTYLLKMGGKTRLLIKIPCTYCKTENVYQRQYYKNKMHFCSADCQAKYNSESLTGENNPLWKRIEVKCAYCGKPKLIRPYELKQKNRFGESNHFCDTTCQSKFQSISYTGDRAGARAFHDDPENKKKVIENVRKAGLAGLKAGVQFSSIHKKINDILENHGIEYENEYQQDFYSMDILLKKQGLFIEIAGDYWHSNPVKYKTDNERNSVQKSITRRDKSKHTFITVNKQKKILYLWENDINSRPELCEKLIKLYIQNDGCMRNYNSFNYNDDLTLIEETVLPYFERKSV